MTASPLRAPQEHPSPAPRVAPTTPALPDLDENRHSTGGGTIRTTREDYERYFDQTDIGQVP
ncbi:hypothetical protein [Actinomyces wuliandei]|uniref:hypothetical protein n=1 Tax=Actinomyces wuliandei TaxID=2057743 RepID=UPI000FD83DA5|nr:hypothetical protein [Actinomyces wuliandei]